MPSDFEKWLDDKGIEHNKPLEATEEELIEHMESERKRGNTIERKDIPGPNGVRHLCRISMNGMVIVTEGRMDGNGVIKVYRVPETDWTGENN